MPRFMGLNRDCADKPIEGKSLKYDERNQKMFNFTSGMQGSRISPPNVPNTGPAPISNFCADTPAEGANAIMADNDLLDELQALFNRLGAAKILLSVYLVEFGGLPQRLARPLLQEAAGSCAMLRLPAQGHHLVIYLGPEPSEDRGGFPGRLQRGLAALRPSAPPEPAWAEVRVLRCCNHDIAAPAQLLHDLKAASPRVLGISDW